VSTQKYSNILVASIAELSFLHILLKNLRVVALLTVGSFTLGVPTFLNLFLNGYVLGVVISVFSPNLGIEKLLLLILPHGIFEIPAIIIAGAAGFKIPYEILRYLAGRKEVILTREDIKEYLTLALISIVLIVIAAWIEANVTLRIAERLIERTKGI
jgi:uncharacterized membrane protein SpoIIM required for sporulation